MKWKPGRSSRSVVSDSDEKIPDSYKDPEHVEYCGGFLVAESVPEAFIPIICAAPEMYEIIRACAEGNPADAVTFHERACDMVTRIEREEAIVKSV